MRLRSICTSWSDGITRHCKDTKLLVSFSWLPDISSYLQKTEIRDYVKEQGVPYTFIDVGFWMEISVPHRSSTTDPYASLLRGFYGDGEIKSAVTNRRHIGDFVSRIIADPRTLNQYVFAYDDEVSQKEIYEICGRIAGEDFHKVKETASISHLLLDMCDFDLTYVINSYLEMKFSHERSKAECRSSGTNINIAYTFVGTTVLRRRHPLELLMGRSCILT
jgi:NmrA-like family